MTTGDTERARRRRLRHDRIEALADGIFAVAMTLLVLDVKLPNGEHFATSGALLDRLLSLEHTFVIYFISFVVLGMFWVGHHAHFHYIRYVDHTLLWINLLFLFGITSVPFATDLLGDHNGMRLPYFYYGGKLLVLAGLLIAQIAYLRRHPELAQPSLTARRRAPHRAAHGDLRDHSAAVDGRRVLQYAPRPVPLLPAPGRAFPAGPRRHARSPDQTRPLTRHRRSQMKRVLILGVNGFIGHHLSQRIVADTDWEIYGMDMQSDRVDRPPAGEALPLLRRRHHDQQGVDRVPHQEVRHGAAAGRDRHAGDLRQGAAARLRARLRGEPADRARVRAVPQAHHLPVDLRGVRDVPRRRVRSGALRAGAGPDQQAALDLLVREAADGPRDPRLRHAGGARLHAVPAVQLDRRRARFDQHARRKAARASSRSSSATSSAASRSSWSTAARRSARSPTSTTASPR